MQYEVNSKHTVRGTSSQFPVLVQLQQTTIRLTLDAQSAEPNACYSFQY